MAPNVTSLIVSVETGLYMLSSGHVTADTLDTLTAGSKSQTTKSKEYLFRYKSDKGRKVNIHVIDTPGLSDTEGMILVTLLIPKSQLEVQPIGMCLTPTHCCRS